MKKYSIVAPVCQCFYRAKGRLTAISALAFRPIITKTAPAIDAVWSHF